MLYRQAKVKRIQHHQTSSSTNVKETSILRKYKKKRPTKLTQIIKQMTVGSYISLITWNVNGLNSPSKRHKLAEDTKANSKVAGYKINTQKSLEPLYTNNKKSKRGIKKTILFTIAAKQINYLGIILPKGTKDLYSENYKALMKEFKNNTNRWRDIPYSWIEAT